DQCVRESIQLKPECPACRKSSNESHIRSDSAIEAAVAAWRNARAEVLRLCQEEDARRNAPPPSISHRKRKRSPESTCHSTPPESSTANPVSVSSLLGSRLTCVADDAPVQCPICSKRVQMRFINAHMDNGCRSPSSSDAEGNGRPPRSKGDQKNAWSKILGGGGKGKEKQRSVEAHLQGKYTVLIGSRDDEWLPLPKASYHTLKDKQLKDLLIEQQLPTTGDRQTWVTRHQRWVLLWNANLDNQPGQRKSVSELRTELKRWEESRSKAKKAPVVEDPTAYEKANKDQFARLIEAARPKKSVSPGEAAVDKPPDSPAASGNDDDPDVIIVD
ncbi:hypothetical protein GLOTRDRAFT_36698, partial [Gloeophyllum trabeum ATCC 11539]